MATHVAAAFSPSDGLRRIESELIAQRSGRDTAVAVSEARRLLGLGAGQSGGDVGADPADVLRQRLGYGPLVDGAGDGRRGTTAAQARPRVAAGSVPAARGESGADRGAGGGGAGHGASEGSNDKLAEALLLLTQTLKGGGRSVEDSFGLNVGAASSKEE